MALNRRPRQNQRIDEHEIEAFGEKAELPRNETTRKPASAIPAIPAIPATPRELTAGDWRTRNKEPKTTGLNFRFSKSQSALLRAAADDQDVSQQKVLERIIWPYLEERYGNPSS